VTARRPVWALQILVVGLAVHNIVMARLWEAGVHGSALSAISAWKDVLLLLALAILFFGRSRFPWPSTAADRLAVLFGALIVVYGLLPQGLLGGGATHKGVLFAARHDLLPVGAYFLGRGLELTDRERSRLCTTVLVTAAGVALYGLVDVYAVPLSWWRHSGAPGWFRDQLGLDYTGLSGLPQNFVYNAGNGVVFRRLTSTFLSPLATSYLLVVAIVFIPRRRWWTVPLGALLFAALLWTHTRSALLALVAVFVLRAAFRRSVAPLLFATAMAVVGFGFVKGYTHFGPRTHFTPSELKIQEQIAKQHPQQSNNATSANESSLSEHASSLRQGVHTVVHHPWGYGLGNAGVTAERTHVKLYAGESTYTELGVEAGLAGALAFVAWSLALVVAAFRTRPWVGFALLAMLLLGLQTDIIGVPWVAVVVWAFAGDAVARRRVHMRGVPFSAIRL
jgi:O-Antigen ligase